MNTLAVGLILLVALLHVYFLILEMFLWQRPLGLRTFRNTSEKAALTAVLAKNQGLYNGFLAAGLLSSFAFPDAERALAFRVFFLTCVVIAGGYGAATVNRRILFVQAVPAALALTFVFLSR